jgi:hypothetical protein
MSVAFGCCVLPVFIAFVCRLLCLYVKKKTILGTKQHMSLCLNVFGNAPLSGDRRVRQGL